MNAQTDAYRAGMAKAFRALSTAKSREVAVDQIIEIADRLRKEDPLFLYRDFFADIGVSEWEEFKTKESDDA